MAGMPKEPFSYEFSAPRFHDFSGAQSPAALVDAWFERQPHTEKKSVPQLDPAQEVSDVPQQGCSQAEDTSADQENKPTHPAKLVNTNIVTGWGMTEGNAQQKSSLLGNTRATGSEDKVDQQAIFKPQPWPCPLKRSCSEPASDGTAQVSDECSRPTKRSRAAAPQEKTRGKADSEQQGKWRSMAEQVAAFEKKPRSSPRLAAAALSQQLTSPQSPHLATLQRQRPSRFKSHDEEGAAFMAEVQERHRPNSSGSKGAPDLATSRRARAASHGLEAVPEEPCFKAQPLNHHILEAATFVPQPSERPLTVSHAPELHTDARVRPEKVAPSRDASEGKPFKARPAPSSTSHQAPLKDAPQKPLTLPKPFDLASQSRHEQAVEQHTLKVQKQQDAAKAAASFQAHELPPDLGPWQPQPCDKALTIPTAPHLALETRSAARARFDAGQEEKALLAEDKKKLAEAERAAKEAQEVAELRKTMVFKASKAPQQRVRAKKKGPVARPRLTLPKSPCLATRARKSARR